MHYFVAILVLQSPLHHKKMSEEDFHPHMENTIISKLKQNSYIFFRQFNAISYGQACPKRPLVSNKANIYLTHNVFKIRIIIIDIQ